MKKLDNESFIRRSIKFHGEFYDYSKVVYKNQKENVCIICPIHGEFWQNPFSHFTHHGCAACSKNKKLTTNKFIEIAQKIHGEFYEYSNVIYINAKSKICIICPIHGEFFCAPDNHISKFNKCGCPKCGLIKLSKKLPGGYNYKLFKLKPELKIKPSFLYLVEMNNKNKEERFYKIGITTNNLETRFKGCKYEWIKIFIKKLPLLKSFQMEQKIKNKFKNLQYTPKIKFSGWTECFFKDVKILKFIETS